MLYRGGRICSVLDRFDTMRLADVLTPYDALRCVLRDWCRATGDEPLVTYGVHASPDRIVNSHEA
jgi:hypothetical protein